jgi:soluble lytic murein transglycosylase-like protein
MQERELRALAAQMAERYGLDPAIFTRQIEKESGFNPNARNEKTGATGLGQVMSATAQDPGFGVTPLRDRLDAAENLRFSAEYMAAMLRKYDGDYPQGSGCVQRRSGDRGRLLGGIPDIAETRDYVAKIMNSPMRSPLELGPQRRLGRWPRSAIRLSGRLCWRRRALLRGPKELWAWPSDATTAG